MSQQIQNNLETNQFLLLAQIDQLKNSPGVNTPAVQKQIEQLQLAYDKAEQLQGFIAKNNPQLDPPSVNLDSIKNLTGGKALTAESLLEALNMQERKNAIQEGLNSVNARAAEKADASQQKIEKLKEQIEKIEEQSKMGIFGKIFKFIAMAAGVVAAVAGIVAGVAGLAAGGSGALLIAGSTILLAASISAITAEATDGKVSIGAGISKAFEAMGVDKEIAQYIGMGFEIGVTVLGAALTLGAGAGSAASMLAKIGDVAMKVSAGITAASGIVSSGLEMKNAALSYERKMDEAFLKDLEALMQRLELADEMDLDTVKALMDQFNKLIEGVQQLVENTNTANIAIAGGAPAMA